MKLLLWCKREGHSLCSSLCQSAVDSDLCHGWQCNSVVECAQRAQSSGFRSQLEGGAGGGSIIFNPTKNIIRCKERAPGEFSCVTSRMHFFFLLALGGGALIAGEKCTKKTLHACFLHSSPSLLDKHS